MSASTKARPRPRGAVERSDKQQGVFLVALAVFFFSLSPVLVRWATTLSAYEITVGRLLTAGTTVLTLAWLRGEQLPARAAWPRFAGFGLITGLHFAFYIASLRYTSIAHSLALVYTAPLFIALLSHFWLDEQLTTRQWLGVLIAVLGVAVLAGFEPAFTRQMLLGDLLALGSAICFAFYSISGRKERNQTPLFAYAGTVYTLGGLWLLPAAALNFHPAGYTLRAILSVLALGLLPMALGHTLYNAALRRTNATLVNLIATQEVTGGVLLGIWLLGEMPSPSSVVGAMITLVGIVLVSR